MGVRVKRRSTSELPLSGAWLRFVLVGAVLTLAVGMTMPARSAASDTVSPPAQPASGPGGSDYRFAGVERSRFGASPTGVFVFTPEGGAEKRAALPLVIFVHGFTAVDPDFYGAWIEHLVRRGAVVVYPDYQGANPLAGTQDAYLGDMMAGVRTALRALGERGEAPVAVVGHSLGAILAVNYAAVAAKAGFPAPDVLMAVEPGGCRSCGEGGGFGVPLPAAPVFSKDLGISVVVGNDDDVVGEGDALAIWELIGAGQQGAHAYVRVHSDRHGEPPLVADHIMPQTAGRGTLDALDWNGLWRLLDLQLQCTDRTSSCPSPFGDGDVADMGLWSDGVPVARLAIGDPFATAVAPGNG